MTIKLISIVPYQQSERDGDELFLMLNGDRIWPVSKKYQHVGTGKEPVGIVLQNATSPASLDFELWEYDSMISKECLGEFKIFADKPGGPFEASLIRRGKDFCNYVLQWEAH
jgi:hypothetical protein